MAAKPSKALKLLFADDEPSLQQLMSVELPRMGHEVTVCPDGLTAVAALEKNSFDCLLVDLDMPGLSGIQVIDKAKSIAPDTEAVILTGKSTQQSAIAAVNNGTFAYLTKPCKLADLELLLQRVAEKRALMNRVRALERQLRQVEGSRQLVGDSPAMNRVRQLIAKVAPTESTVLIRGETGTGKELAARAVHDQSLRASQPFVAINCGALPESLIESELFGHRKGAFTGAEEHRVGMFEVANGGTVFLDEIGELPKAMQAKLLRVLESGEIRRVGDNQATIVDVRVVCATHRDLEQMVADGDFREDLMFRINTFEVRLPTLRDRKDDIPALAEHMLRRFRPATNSSVKAFSSQAMKALQEHVWPGNVRELANVIEHAAILCDTLPIQAEHLPANFGARQLRPTLRAISMPMTLREMEMRAIEDALDRHAGNKSKAAEELGVSLKTLYNKLNQAAAQEQSAA
jgi:two-component system NtrC family response regulator